MPGAVARTSTFALNHATLPYGLRLVDQGLEEAVRESRPMELGLNTYRGRVTHEAVAESLEMEYTEPTSLM
jgi:alanine dehydrogenase